MKATNLNNTKKAKLSAKGLEKLHLLLALALGAQGIIILLISNSKLASQSITSGHITKDTLASQGAGHPVYVAASHHLFDLKLVYVVVAMLLINALMHLMPATQAKKMYEENMKKGISKPRWIGISITTSLMLVSIGMLAGVLDFGLLLIIITLNIVGWLLAMVMETSNYKADRVNWQSFKLSSLAMAAVWIVVGLYVWTSHSYGNLPDFVVWLYLSVLALTIATWYNMRMQFKKSGAWSNYLYAERNYLIISLVAQSALAWQIYAGALK